MKDFLKQLIASAPDNNLARRNLVREYLQARVLQLLQESGAYVDWAFLGGTALRFLYGISRFSEDLDFSLVESGRNDHFRDRLKRVQQGFTAENYAVDIKVSDRKVVKSAFVRFRDLFYELQLSAQATETLAIKIEIDTNPPPGAATETTLVRRHVPLNLLHYDRACLLAGKLHALIARPYLKGRDLYDLVWYLADASWPEPNICFLNAALRQTDWPGPVLQSDNWRQVVWQALDAIDWKGAVDDVRPFLERPADIDLLTRENCRKLLRA